MSGSKAEAAAISTVVTEEVTYSSTSANSHFTHCIFFTMLRRKSRGWVHRDGKAAFSIIPSVSKTFLPSVQLHKQIMTQFIEDHTAVYEKKT